MGFEAVRNEERFAELERKGLLYFVDSVIQPVGATSYYFIWHTGEKAVHMVLSKQSTLYTTYSVKEGITVTTIGSEESVWNRNRVYIKSK
jgi:hypothetical protein